MAAKEDALGALHEALATILAEALKGQTLPAEYDEDGVLLNPETVIPPSASVMTVAAKFLKDNNITSAPSKDNAIGALKEAQEARAKEREARRARMQTPGAKADGLDFMDGLPKH